MLSLVRHLGRLTTPRAATASLTSCCRSVTLSRSSSSSSSSSSIPSSTTSSASGNRRSRLFGLAGLAGVAAGGIWAAYSLEKDRRGKLHQPALGNESDGGDDLLLSSPPPPFPPARVISNPGDTSGLKLTLFQYQTCPFCCKTRAFLDYFGLSYNVIEVNSITRKQTKWSKYKKVPILVAETPDGRVIQLNDSSLIISALTSFLRDKSSTDLLEVLACYPRLKFRDENNVEKEDVMNKYFLMFRSDDPGKGKDQLEKERKWRKWADDSLVHTLSPNVYRTPSESLQAFRWFDSAGDWQRHFTPFERQLVIYAGAAVMWVIGHRLKRRHHLKDDVRLSLYEDCDLWAKSVRETGNPFMGGQKPDLSDLAVFGCLSAIEGCDAFKDLLNNTEIGPWFSATKAAVRDGLGGV